MGKCIVCGVDAGWGNVYCKPEQKQYTYGQRFKIKTGFYTNQVGKLININERGFEMQLDDGSQIEGVNAHNLELIL